MIMMMMRRMTMTLTMAVAMTMMMTITMTMIMTTTMTMTMTMTVQDSVICLAGIHAGTIGSAGGVVTWQVQDGARYNVTAQTAHGVTSLA